MMDSWKPSPRPLSLDSRQCHHNTEGQEYYKDCDEGEAMQVAAANQVFYSSTSSHVPLASDAE